MAEEEHFDVVVVGAGMSSLAAAKEYIQCAPHTNLIVLDSHKTVGGVWSKDRVYDGLRTNNLRGALELADYPFPDDLGAPHGEHIPGHALAQYFEQYAEKFDIARRVRFETTALEAEKLDNGWRLDVETKGTKYKITAGKLIVGTGLASRPQKMRISGDETFDAPFVHAGELGSEGYAIAKDPNVERVTVYGGSKYAWDSVYTFASAGKPVDWVIRKSGHGPTWITKITANLPILGRIWAELLVTTRFINWFSPFPWEGLDGAGWWRRFLHGTWLGQKIVGGFWKKMGEEMQIDAGFRNDPKLKPLWPDCDFFDIATSFATLNYPMDILDFVRSGQVKVYREDIDHLSKHAVHLANGTKLDSDAIVASTGWEWKPTFNFKDTHLHADIGIPSTFYTDTQKAFWNDLDSRTDAHVLNKFPLLRNRPIPPKPEELSKANPYDYPPNEKKPDYTPLRLYRTIAPPGLASRDLAFVGFGANISHSMKAEIKGLWVYAYFNDLLTIDPFQTEKEQVYWETSLMQRWSIRRHSYGWGMRFPDFIWDPVAWNDVLMGDLGLSGCRKGGSWWRECFEPYRHEDYRGVTEEWLAKKRVEGKVKST